MKYQTPPRKFDREFTITAPARELDKIEAECRLAKAERFLKNTDFHGSPEVFDFPTLREALARGIATKTAEAAAALKTITEKSCGVKLRRTDEPARIVDISAYLQGVPECYYKPTAQTKPHYKLAIFNSFPWWTPAHYIANRAAAIVALAKQMKAAGASISAAIVFRQVHESGASAQTLFPVNLSTLKPIRLTVARLGAVIILAAQLKKMAFRRKKIQKTPPEELRRARARLYTVGRAFFACHERARARTLRALWQPAQKKPHRKPPKPPPR